MDQEIKLIVSRSFIVQIGGGLLSLNKTPKTAKLGLHIVTGGVIFQQALIVLFMVLSIQFSAKLKREPLRPEIKRGPSRLVCILRISLLLITVSSQSLPNSNHNFLTRISVPHHLPHRGVLLPSRLLHKQLHQPPRVLPLRLRLDTDVHRSATDEHLASRKGVD